MNITYYDTPIIKRAYELEPGDIIIMLGTQYKVMRIARNVILKSMHGKELGGIPINIGSKSRERVEVIGHWPVVIQNRKIKHY